MTEFSNRWLISNSKTIERQIIYPYCQKSDASLNQDHFLTYSESGKKGKEDKKLSNAPYSTKNTKVTHNYIDTRYGYSLPRQEE